MIKINLDDFYVINSNKEVIIFNKAEDETISSESLNFRSEEKAYLYSLTIDQEDNIYLIILSKTGELNLYTFNNLSWTKDTIGQFDIRYNNYNQIEVKFINGKIHIIYNYSNISNSNIWIIQHIVYDNIIEEKNNIQRYISVGNIEPFRLDFDNNGNIHLLYINNSLIYYNLYNPYTRKWNKSSQISLDEGVNNKAYLFVDSKDNIHCLWINSFKNKRELKYMKMSSKGKDPYIWKRIKLPIVESSIIPIIYEENHYLKIIYSIDTRVKYIKSSDFGNNWTLGDIDLPGESIDNFIKIATNLNDSLKAHHIIKDLSSILIDEFPLEEVQIEEIDKNIEEEETILEETPVKEDRLSLILENQEIIKSLLLSLIETQEQYKDEVFKSLKSLESKKSLFEKLFS